MKQQRKIIQIAASAVALPEGNGLASTEENLYALTDDGSVWRWTGDHWTSLTPMPQGTLEQEAEKEKARRHAARLARASSVS